MEKKRIILVGGGGHCRSCIDVIEQTGIYIVAGIIDKVEMVGRKILNSNVIGTDDDIPYLDKNIEHFIITLGQIGLPKRRKELFNLLVKLKKSTPAITSPHAYVSPYAKLGKGTIVMHKAIVNAGAKIGNNCIINSNALIEHDAVIGNHCHISTGTIINGGANVGDESFIGSGAIAVQNALIPSNSFVKANSLFIKK